MNLLNKAQADALFQLEAVMLGSGDVVTVARAVELFGSAAVEWAKNGEDGRDWNVWGRVGYLTLSGFQRAVTYYNVQQLEKAQRTAEETQT